MIVSGWQMMSNLLSWFSILYGTFGYRTTANLGLITKTQALHLFVIEGEVCQPHKRRVTQGKMKPTYISVQLTKTLRRQGTPSINLFWTTNTVPESNLVRRQMGGGNPQAWRMWWPKSGWGTPDTSLYYSIRQNQLKGVIAGRVLTTLLKILFFCVIEEVKGETSLSALSSGNLSHQLGIT